MRDYQNATPASIKAPFLWTKHSFMDDSSSAFPWSLLFRKLKAAVAPFPQLAFKDPARYNPYANNTAAAFSQAESQILATPPFIFYRDVIKQVLSMNNQLGEI